MVDVMFGRRSPHFASSPPPWQPLNAGLDASQRAAVGLALAAQDLALIHGGWVGVGASILYKGIIRLVLFEFCACLGAGPPGTGKTTAVIEVILQEVARGK